MLSKVYGSLFAKSARVLIARPQMTNIISYNIGSQQKAQEKAEKVADSRKIDREWDRDMEKKSQENLVKGKIAQQVGGVFIPLKEDLNESKTEEVTGRPKGEPFAHKSKK